MAASNLSLPGFSDDKQCKIKYMKVQVPINIILNIILIHIKLVFTEHVATGYFYYKLTGLP